MDEKWAEKKKVLSEKNQTVTRPIARLDTQCLPSKKRTSRTKYSPRKMLNLINKYFQWCEDNDELPSISGMMVHMGFYQDRFYAYLKKPEFSDMMEQARLIIRNWAETDVYNTKGMAAGKINYMKNLHGWSDKLETNNYTEQRVVSVDEARAKIEALAPKLLEVLRSTNVVNQIGHVEEAEIVEGK